MNRTIINLSICVMISLVLIVVSYGIYMRESKVLYRDNLPFSVNWGTSMRQIEKSINKKQIYVKENVTLLFEKSPLEKVGNVYPHLILYTFFKNELFNITASYKGQDSFRTLVNYILTENGQPDESKPSPPDGIKLIWVAESEVIILEYQKSGEVYLNYVKRDILE